MAFHPQRPETYHEASDEELLGAMGRDTKNIGWALQAEILRRQVAKMTETTQVFNKANEQQTQQTLELSQSALRVARRQTVIMWLTAGIGIAVALFGICVTWKINRDAIARDQAKEVRQAQSIVDGIQLEMIIADAQCRAFLVEEVKVARELGSPAWIAQTGQVQNGLSSGIFDENLKATAALQRLLTDLISLNERNHLMANAAVDNLSAANKAGFLKDNLRRYGENCSSVIEDITFGRPIVLSHAKARGLKADLIDFGKIDLFPPRHRTANVTKRR